MKRLTPKDLVEVINMPQGCDMTRFIAYAHRLWELENLLESGKLIELPCKVGDPIYVIRNPIGDLSKYAIYMVTYSEILFTKSGIRVKEDWADDPIFVCDTLEQAEAKLKELQEVGK